MSSLSMRYSSGMLTGLGIGLGLGVVFSGHASPRQDANGTPHKIQAADQDRVEMNKTGDSTITAANGDRTILTRNGSTWLFAPSANTMAFLDNRGGGAVFTITPVPVSAPHSMRIKLDLTGESNKKTKLTWTTSDTDGGTLEFIDTRGKRHTFKP